MNTLVSPENTWVLLAIMCSAAGISIYLEQHYAWASKLSGAIIALVFAFYSDVGSLVRRCCLGICRSHCHSFAFAAS